jgi:RNA-directed DNA polymerase
MILERIAPETGLNSAYIALVARTATHRYKTYQIPKATGGLRTIDHPARELKLLQLWLVNNLFSQLPVHEDAYAYRKGRNILAHASVHAAQNYLLKVDFRDFFPSITGLDVFRVLETNASIISPPLNIDDYGLVRSLVCRRDRLTIGAPSSPALSNAVMFEFDTYWAERCRSDQVIYSRYADDLYFSANRPNILSILLTELRTDLQRRESPRLIVNETKTAFTSRKRRCLVTGLVLTSDRRVSLGRAAKRKIKSLIFQHGRGNSDSEGATSLRGLISYVRSVDPRFIATLQRKFGPKLNGLA